MQRVTEWRVANKGRATSPLVLVGLGLFVAGVYVIVVLGGGLLIGQTESPNLGLSILATALVAFGFEPVQAGLERLAAKLFPTARVTPYDILNTFAGAVSGTYAVDEVAARMAQVLTEGTAAQWSQVWLVVQGEPTLAATWPPGAASDTSPPGSAAPPGRHTLPVRQGEDLLGVLRLQRDPFRPMSPIEQSLFAGLAGQAAAVLRGVRLRVERSQRVADLSVRAEELRRSRSRLVEAQDAARRRLERDLHDGAQQHLVAMAVNLRLADTIARRSPQRAAELLATQRDAVTEMRTVLVDLSRGIYPRLLTEEGLGPALAAALSASPVPVEVATHQVGRYGIPVEAALYFCCLEAVQNAGKHSNAQHVTIDLTDDCGSLVLTVEDDGENFTRQPTPGVGLANMRDRIESIGGTLLIEATGTGGARVRACVTSSRGRDEPWAATGPSHSPDLPVS